LMKGGHFCLPTKGVISELRFGNSQTKKEEK